MIVQRYHHKRIATINVVYFLNVVISVKKNALIVLSKESTFVGKVVKEIYIVAINVNIPAQKIVLLVKKLSV